jgi:NADH-quinone oxidoreductase subunit J
MLINFLYYFFATLIALGLIFILLTSHIVYAILSLIGVVICLSALYFLQGATWIAIMQLIIHVGGILVLLVVSLLLIKPISADTNRAAKSFTLKMVAGISMFACFIVFVCYLYKRNIPAFATPNFHPITTTIQELGYQLLGTYGFAFELISIMMLVVLVGVIYIIIPKHINSKYVSIKPLTDSKALLMEEIKEAVDEIILIRAGEKKARDAEDFLNEL